MLNVAKADIFGATRSRKDIQAVAVNVEPSDERKKRHIRFDSVVRILNVFDDCHDGFEHLFEARVDLVIFEIETFNWTLLVRLVYRWLVHFLLYVLHEYFNQLFVDEQFIEFEFMQVFH